MDYELPWKSTMLDSHVRTQLGAFDYAYHNFQFEELNLSNGNTGATNLPTSKIYGMEATVQAQLGGCGADAGLSYVHSNLPSAGPFVNAHLLPPGTAGGQCGQDGNPGSPPGCFNYTPYLQTASSGPILYSPEWTFNAGVEYKISVADGVTLTPRANYSYVSRQFTSLTYSEVTDNLRSHGLVSALITLRLHDHWGVETYGTNLSSKIYRTGQGLDNANYYFYGASRQFGVRARYQF